MSDIVLVNTTTNGIFFNVNGHIPGITYELYICGPVEVSQGGDIIDHSQINDLATDSTECTDQWNLCCIGVELFVCCMSLNVLFQTCNIHTCTYEFLCMLVYTTVYPHNVPLALLNYTSIKYGYGSKKSYQTRVAAAISDGKLIQGDIQYYIII